MSDALHRRRRSHTTAVLIAIVTVIMLAEAGLVVAVFVSPSAGDSLRGAVARIERAWEGTDRSPGARTKAADAARRTYDDWIKPLWAGPVEPKPDDEFAACVDCHPDYATKRRFSSVFMDHPLHDQQGLGCADCHTENTHPDPLRPEERTCAECHTEVQDQGSCGVCHPPSSLPHFYLLGAPRDEQPRCDMCHPRDSFDTHATEPLVHVGRFDGTAETECTSCHAETACEACHADGDAHPSDWLAKHGDDIAYGGPSDCGRCHTSTWCADRCHAVTSTNPFVPRPLPTDTGGTT
jgi:hypothetical protein